MSVTDLRNAMLQKTCRCAEGPIDCLGESDVLSQWAPADTFRDTPRADIEVGMSVQRGRLSPEECQAAMFGRARRPKPSSQVRYTTVGALRQNGFQVIHTPGKVANSQHCSVIHPADGGVEQAFVPWAPEVTELFNQCFDVVKIPAQREEDHELRRDV